MRPPSAPRKVEPAAQAKSSGVAQATGNKRLEKRLPRQEASRPPKPSTNRRGQRLSSTAIGFRQQP
ncbi:hypothetical protein HMPREF0972_01773 [Actinomyces sp. oral taxon 848 str. F0332]|nr:hypothetical protein HMPREF0972_01773 [Actinomyces sp. oral taxon 848 str. F0332]